MLIEFSVGNFRSFRERQTLSMVAAPRLRKKENTFKPDVAEVLPALLKVAVIYGPNASGKSNLLRALEVVEIIANREPNASKRPLPVAPFLFDKDLIEKPSEFELHFIQNGLRYQFNLAVTQLRVMHEELHVFPKGVDVLLYSRQHSSSGDIYSFGEEVEASNDLLEAWKRLTPPNLLFISQAVANSSEEFSQFSDPFAWIQSSSLILRHGMGSMAGASRRLAAESEMHSDAIAAFLREIDVPVASIRVEDRSDQKIGALDLFGDEDNSFRKRFSRPDETYLTHRTALGEAEIRFEDESEGTKNLIGFWLPWATRESTDVSDRCVLVVDELDSSLHPKIVSALVSKHISSHNPSQLIFTTHDTHLMDVKLLRRDQIWITDRDMNGATQLRSIHDFKGREGEDIEKRYYEGRYRGLPIVRE